MVANEAMKLIILMEFYRSRRVMLNLFILQFLCEYVKHVRRGGSSVSTFRCANFCTIIFMDFPLHYLFDSTTTIAKMRLSWAETCRFNKKGLPRDLLRGDIALTLSDCRQSNSRFDYSVIKTVCISWVSRITFNECSIMQLVWMKTS